jgi:hypothetical protein
MTDDRTTGTNPSGNGPEEDHDYHSQLEIDDTSGWRVFIVPGALLLFVIGGLLFIFLYQGDDTGPDPRIANRLTGGQQEQAVEPGPPTIPVQVEDRRGMPADMPDNQGEPIMQDSPQPDAQPVQ